MSNRIVYHRCGEEQPQCYDVEVSGTMVGRVWTCSVKLWCATRIDGLKCGEVFDTRGAAGHWIEHAAGGLKLHADSPIMRMARRLKARREQREVTHV
jgi:hypothetical protein